MRSRHLQRGQHCSGRPRASGNWSRHGESSPVTVTSLKQMEIRCRVRTALQTINSELDAYFAEQEGDLDPDTRFCTAWFEQHSMGGAAFGEADVLARAKK